jgi:hypothetical protein
MAQGATAKDTSANRGRARTAKRRGKPKPDRVPADTRSRSAAADRRKRAERSRVPEKAKSPARRGGAGVNKPKNKRQRAIRRVGAAED